MKTLMLKVMFLSCLACMIACTGYTTRTELNRGKYLKKITAAGILLRLPMNPRIPRSELGENIAQWISPARQLKKTVIVGKCDDAVCSYTELNRFFQLSDDSSSYLSFKSRGVINLYLRQNGTALKKMMSDESLDGIIIYEIYPVLSFEMQFMDFDSVICIVDRDLNIAFLDHQSNRYESDEINYDKMKKNLMDKISERLFLILKSLSFLAR